ncbi:TetR/AcrR family transcriptional regulator [Nocardia cyriacigeorgica]|uniref:TetR/AcrR family transcriptional regulator n=1 Tax=Nocardia cyriacigeorgica TaxID=135487 RepID=UPI0013D1779C|nr:TetR/AcrR family transcriptional regulator [Nocardia cyriacigeorgica]NEW29718.1 TetR/AcrR family transcriptional regulator [Nocardia cyriacigeorgica]
MAPSDDVAAAATTGKPSTGRRVTKRRAETRQRLLGAAYEVFAEQGFGRTKPDHICERAGYTRGAFYSQFTSMDELFLAMWEQQSAQLLANVTAVLREDPVTDVCNVREVVEHVLHAVPMDDKWQRISLEVTAHALRNPGLRDLMVAREESISSALLPVVQTLLNRIGRTVTDPKALGRALVAVHDGTAVQCLMEPGSDEARELRVDLMLRVVMSYTREQ